jgi:alkylation response protein AidB-like acyl-CoA dehydrogenase
MGTNSVNGEMGPISSPLPPDYLFMLVNTDPQGPRYKNLAMVIVDAHDPGVSVRYQRTIMGTILKTYALQDVRIPPENIVGGETGGWEVAQTLVQVEHGEPGTTAEQRRQVEERELRYWTRPAP